MKRFEKKKKNKKINKNCAGPNYGHNGGIIKWQHCFYLASVIHFSLEDYFKTNIYLVPLLKLP